jgi:hypothetical protein
MDQGQPSDLHSISPNRTSIIFIAVPVARSRSACQLARYPYGTLLRNWPVREIELNVHCPGEAGLDHDVLTVEVASIPLPFEQGRNELALDIQEESNSRNLTRPMLRARRERPRYRCPAEQRDELASS